MLASACYFWCVTTGLGCAIRAQSSLTKIKRSGPIEGFCRRCRLSRGRGPIRERTQQLCPTIHLLPHDSTGGSEEDGGGGGGGMVMWVFGYGSLVWNPGFAYDARLVGFVRDYRRVFYQGSTDHRGTPEFPGRTVTLEHQPGSTCWGVAYKISKEQDKETALEYLEVREKQYDEKVYLDLYTDSSPKTPVIQNMMVYLATTNKEANQNYLGPAPLEEMAKQIYLAEGPTGPNKEYLFKLEDALNKIGVADQHVQDLADAVRKYSDDMLSH
uniref:Uncharacterized protein n=1 Tax=Avena sativa TaxID=4498 RepID=A0ACD5UBU0_AVESA